MRCTQALARLRRDSATRFAVLFLDLDRFKLINDSVGHLVGDELLKQAGAAHLPSAARTRFVARLGGDEFAILLERRHRPDDAYRRGRARASTRCAEPMRHRRQGSVHLRQHRHRHEPRALPNAGGDCCATPTSPCTAPRRAGDSASRCSTSACTRTRCICSISKAICAAPCCAASSSRTSSRSCACPTRTSSATRRCCAGAIRNAACCCRRLPRRRRRERQRRADRLADVRQDLSRLPAVLERRRLRDASMSRRGISVRRNWRAQLLDTARRARMCSEHARAAGSDRRRAARQPRQACATLCKRCADGRRVRRARRFRHRLFVAELPAPLPAARAEDRPLVRRRPWRPGDAGGSAAVVRAMLALAATLGMEVIAEGIETTHNAQHCSNWVATGPGLPVFASAAGHALVASRAAWLGVGWASAHRTCAQQMLVGQGPP